jgi:D-glycero-alpha-D-manno-heptose-7-phosphate kinase
VEVRARAPLRLGLAGGGTDLRSYSDQFGGVVVNATIARYVNVRIRPREDGKVCFVSYDTNQSELHDCSENLDIREMPLFVAAYNRMMELSGKTQKIPMTIEAVSDSPVGSGLGTSSTLTVTLLKGLSEYLLTPLNRYSIAETAYEVEREECGFSGGLQDQYAASFGGFNQIIFRKNRKVSVRPIPIERSFLNTLESQMLLYFSGRSRESSTIIDSQIANIARGGAVDSLHSIKAEAEEMRGVLMRGDLSRLSDSIRSGWERKKETSSNITNPNIEQVLAAIEEVGISCAKVSGAGGGGFIFIIVPLESRNRVIEILEQFGGFTGGCRFVDKGVESWRA